MPKRQSHLELIISLRLRNAGILFETEYRFDQVRLWRFDFAIMPQKIALEAEGGVWIGGRHNRGSGFVKDIEKYNAAVLDGWRILRYTRENIDQLIPNLRRLL